MTRGLSDKRTPRSHNVYVVRLDPAVLKHRKFRKANPVYVEGRPCVYVGMTGLSPEERFQNHKRGHKGNWYVKEYGIRLMPEWYAKSNPLSYEDAQEWEYELAERLRGQGWAVWQN